MHPQRWINGLVTGVIGTFVDKSNRHDGNQLGGVLVKPV